MVKLATKNPTPTFAWQNLAQRIYPILLLLAIGALSWVLASVIWLVMSPPTAPVLQPIALTPPQTKPINPNLLDVFAKPNIQPASQPPPDIKIVGVTVSDPDTNSYAILNSGGKALSYRVGDMIGTSQYKLTKVVADGVFVTSPNGVPQKIEFGQKFSLDQSEAIRAKTQNAINSGTSTSQGMPSNPATANNPVISNNPVANNLTNPTRKNADTPNTAVPNPMPSATNNANTAQSALGNAATALQQNSAGYLSSMGVTATGQGYQVTDAMPANIKNRIGLQTGDRVLSVNGQNIGQNPTQDAQLLQQVQQSGQAQIQVQRGEQVITIRQSL